MFARYSHPANKYWKKEFIEFKGITISDFENTINIGNGVLNEAINSRTEINSKWLVVISANYPELNFNLNSNPPRYL